MITESASRVAQSLILHFEPFHSIAAQQSPGRWVVGFGHLSAPGATATRQCAGITLARDIVTIAQILDTQAHRYGVRLNDAQMGALVSLHHSGQRPLGRDQSEGCPAIAGYLAAGNEIAAAEWIRDSNGIVRRRWAEAVAFLGQDWTPFRNRHWFNLQKTVQKTLDLHAMAKQG